ncbi:hypothetical protein CD30_12445 [Ureibacillus massiliensis 4400831 = CIP 108448 = CCUG 49529]|uniref:RNA-binding protein KhpB N-terminal domain-containing protein n=1 Tax=Ureibacillus massiliensis 4400831 = CIP 108448 = CCUG 49529 TaxID=1211035 RepID=A0A0A3JTG9_9BACL|nr:flagellar assembly protein A [Ureibacillus massiliensis]KGR90272.1 hypothetical protein CD30_12445 [Ureibacillus massiliensis 4400831 = CIP 108448 = CCUG 49529]
MGELITSKGKNAKEAVDLALSLLGKDISEVEIEILKHEEKSFLGLKSKPAVVRVKVKDEVMLIEDELNESSHLVTDNDIDSASQSIEEFLSSIENESQNTDVNFNLDPFEIENLRGKAWIIDGKIYCKDAGNKYPLIEPSKDVRIFKNGMLIQSTEIITETDVFKIEAPSEEILPSWELSISKDKLEVRLQIKVGKKISYTPIDLEPSDYLKIETVKAITPLTIQLSEVLNKLKELRVVHGIDYTEINKACATEEDGDYIIAKGTPATQGKNGTFQLFNDIEVKKQLKERVDGSVDFRETREFPSVHFGQIIGEAMPPIEGKSGMDVTGTVIEPEAVYPIILKAGTGVILVDNSKVVSTETGYPEVKIVGQLATVSVVPKLVIQHDVTIETGNVHYLGAVEVKASIQDNMTVEAKGNIKVGSNVIRAKVLSGKSIIVENNIIASSLTSGNGILQKLELSKELLRFSKGLKNLIVAMKQLSQASAFKVQSLNVTGLGPLVKILFNSKFKDMPPLINSIVNRTREYSSILESDWIDFAELINKEFIAFHQSSLKNEEDLERIVSQAESLYLPVMDENEAESTFIRANFVQSSDLYSSGDILITGQGVYSSKLYARKNIKINGFVRGGDIYAENSVIINEVGFRASSYVKINVSKDGYIKIKSASPNTIIQVGGQSQILYNPAKNIDARLDQYGNLVISKEE